MSELAVFFTLLYAIEPSEHSGVLSRQKLSELVSEIDPKQVLDEEVEDVNSQESPKTSMPL